MFDISLRYGEVRTNNSNLSKYAWIFRMNRINNDGNSHMYPPSFFKIIVDYLKAMKKSAE